MGRHKKSRDVRCTICGRYVSLTYSDPAYMCALCKAIMTAKPIGGWISDALCAEIGGDLWFAEGHGGPTVELMLAKAVCNQCPVRGACLDYALEENEEYGVWGGTTPRERQRMKATRTTEGEAVA